MSAYVVDKAHIDGLVTLASRGPQGVWWEPLRWWNGRQMQDTYGEGRDDEIGAMLLAENVRSVSARYPRDALGELPGPRPAYWLVRYVWSPGRYRPTAIEALKAIACYEYQSCETDDWEQTEAWRFCQALQGAIVSRMPGWDEAAWGWPTGEKEQPR